MSWMGYIVIGMYIGFFIGILTIALLRGNVDED